MTRVYKLTIAEIITLHELLSEYIGDLECCNCDADLCEHCQRNADLRQKFIDARSLAEVGCAVIFTTADELIPKPEVKKAAIQ